MRGWWSRSDISSELKKEIPAGRKALKRTQEGERGERRDPSGVTLSSSRHPLTHTLIHTLRLCVGVLADAVVQKKDECLRNEIRPWNWNFPWQRECNTGAHTHMLVFSLRTVFDLGLSSAALGSVS